MSDYIKLDVKDLKLLFESFSLDDKKTLWVRNSDYSEQLYLSLSYEEIWGRSRQQLYNYPESWGQSLVGEHSNQFVQLLKSRRPGEKNKLNPNNTVLYRIHNPCKDQIVWIKDTHFYLFNELDEQVAVAGIAESIPATRWEFEMEKCCSLETDADNFFKKKFIDGLMKELKLTTCSTTHAVLLDNNNSKYRHVIVKSGERVRLTRQELLCLSHLLQGKTYKQIARMMNISWRTIEKHITNVKHKIGCSNLIDLVTQIRGFAI